MQIQKEEITEFKNTKKAYFIAKALYDAIKERVEKLNAPINQACNEEKISIEEWAEKVTHNEFELGEPEAFQILLGAEKTLFAITQRLLKQRATPEQWKQIEIIYTDGVKMPSIREKALDLALSWDATT